MMKKLFVLFLIISISSVSIAQNGINYKALIKDHNGDVLSSQAVTIQFQILEDGTTTVYQETHTPNTDANGIVTVNIGEGSVDSGNFLTIDWGAEDHFLNVQVDAGDGLVDLGTTQFKSVPYAKHAETVKKLPLTNPKFPNGFEGMNSTTINLSIGNYTVPTGKNLYITNILQATLLQVTRSNIDYRLANGYYNLASNGNGQIAPTEKVLTNPIILKEGDIVTGNSTINGFLIDAEEIDPLIIDINSSAYIVPSGKTFILLNAYSYATQGGIRINNENVYLGFNNGFVTNTSFINRLFYHSFEIPFFANEGDIISDASGGPLVINGYLIDKN